MPALREEIEARIAETVAAYYNSAKARDLVDELTEVVEEILEDFTRAVVKRARERKQQ